MWFCPTCGDVADGPGACAREGQALLQAIDPMLGTKVGSYQVVRKLGEGGMGQVYVGVQPNIGSRVAIKVLNRECLRIPELVERFFAEARAVNLVRSEHIVNVLDLAHLADGRPYIVMELIDGAPLADLVRGRHAPIGGVVQVMLETLTALEVAHAGGVVHRDLKPDNVLVTAGGHAKVLDFGIAKLAPGLSARDSPRTKTGAMLGTPTYMAPEQISGAEKVDARTDLYSLGVMMFESLTGRVPFASEQLFDLMRLHLEAPAPSIRALRPEVPEAIEAVVHQAMAKDPAARFVSAGAMREALTFASRALPATAWQPLIPGASTSYPVPPEISPAALFAAANAGIPAEAHRAATRPAPGDARVSATRMGVGAPSRAAAPSAPPPFGEPSNVPVGAPEKTVGHRRNRMVTAVLVVGALGGVGTAIWGWSARRKPASTVAVAPAGPEVAPPGPEIAPPGPEVAPPPASLPSPVAPQAVAVGSGSSPSSSGSATSSGPTASPSPGSGSTGSGAAAGSAATSAKPGAGPVLVGGGSAVDHGVIVGDNVHMGAGVVIGGQPVVPTGSVSTAPSSPKPKTMVVGPAPPKPRAFDPVAYLPTATALARQLAPDAKLTRFDFDWVSPSGGVDLSRADNKAYEYRSPMGSVRPPNEPKNIELELPCRIVVEVSATGVEARLIKDTNCRTVLVRTPRCSLKQVWALARADGEDATDVVAKISWLHDSAWFFDLDFDGSGGQSRTLQDDC